MKLYQSHGIEIFIMSDYFDKTIILSGTMKKWIQLTKFPILLLTLRLARNS